jgi:FtsH-binding integral membrane protein
MVQSRVNWFILLGAFMAAGFGARWFARSTKGPGAQYFGLGLEVMAWTLIFSPVLWIARTYGGPGTLPTAAGLTVLAFGGLSAYALTTKKDFSFLRPFLIVAGLVALGLVIAAGIFDFELGIWFSAAMILVAIGKILYDTSNIVHDYRTDQHVAASLELFASLALLFWYVLRLVMQLQRR